jgi:hypothetical protein
MAQPQIAGEIVSLAAITSPCQKGATIAWKVRTNLQRRSNLS